jgi:VWFA-related protein
MKIRIASGALLIGAAALAGSTYVSAQAPASSDSQQATFRVQVSAVMMDVLVRDAHGQFVPDLTKDEFEIYEDGVKQDITSMTVSLGGRITNVLQAAPPPPVEGIVMPARRAQADTPGRIFLFFVDDLHLQVENTLRLRALFGQIARTLVHPGDLFAVISSGPSAIEVGYTYDAKRLDEAISRMMGHGLAPNDIIQSGQGTHGVEELRHRAEVVLDTMHDALQDLARLQNRRKVLVWVSEGYDFTPFRESRLGQGSPNNFFQQNVRNVQRSNVVNDDGSHQQVIDPMVEAQKRNELFSDADLGTSLRRLTSEANRVNATIYTIDPRGLVAGQQIDQQVNPTEWDTYVARTQDTMREIAEDTGGMAVVEENNFGRALKRIDAAASDYYMLGYSSSSPDAMSGKHRIEVRVTRPGVTVQSRSEYLARPDSSPERRP